MVKRPIFCFFLALLVGEVLATEYPPLTKLGIGQGLSNNSVRCIFQDHDGFMWFGTYDGLSRYDGYEFTVFRNKLNDTNSLPHNYIYAIDEDSDHRLWVGTGQGIGIYQPLTGKFLPAWYRPAGSQARYRINYNITAIATDAGGDVFIGSNGWGLDVQEEGSDVAQQVAYKSLTGYNVQAIRIDGQQRIWVFIHDVGLCLYDKGQHGLRLVNHGLKNASRMVADDSDNLWLGTPKGLYRYNIAADSLALAYAEGPGGLSSGNIATLSIDREHRLWIGTEGGGIDVVDRHTGKIDYLLPGEGKNDLTSESVYAIYEDKESRQWIGTLKGGIDILDGQKNRFQTIAHNPLVANSLVNNFVSTFFEDRDHHLWIGTDGGGMSIWNRREDRWTNYRHEAGKPASLGSNSITCIRQDHTGAIWISTYGNGIDRFNAARGTFDHFHCVDDATGEENKDVWLIYEDSDQNLWASTFGDGKLYRFNRAENRFEVFSEAYTDLIALTQDRSGVLWGGNSHQLVRIDRQGNRPVIYEIGKPVRAIYEDHRGNFWIGTEGGGLIRFDRAAGKIAARYSDGDGLCNNSVLNILEDDKGFLWLSTFNGLARFNADGKSFKNFYQSDGLQSNQFLYSAALKLQSGELAFGGIDGFNLFEPDDIRPREYMPPLLVTGLRIDNQPRGMHGDLRIPYDQAVLSVDFAALEYSSPNNISYAYFLEGWDKGWNYTSKVRTVNYTNLSEGHYTLRLKSTNAEGVWNTRETALEFTVLPPWYRSPWAWVLYAAFAGALVYFYRRYKNRQTRLEYEIRIAHLDAEKEKEINEKRLSFFTSISHEFRTPLTLIINPLKDILQRNKESGGEEHQEMNIVYRNARRLLSLVDQLLLFRKAESEGDRLKISKLNFYDMCREVYLAFTQKARAGEIDYQFECDNTDLELYADREKMEIVFYNLISNALKYTPAGGKVVFRIGETRDGVDITVSDTGHGIPRETGERLFEKFYQVMEHGRPSQTGFGIGLYLVKQFVESHKGTVRYESEPGQGTTFFIHLLKGNEHLGDRPVFGEAGVRPAILDELAGGQAAGDRGMRTAPSEHKGQRAEVWAAEHKGPGASERQGLGAEIWASERQALLVIDDNEQMLGYIRQLFEDQYTVYGADSGEEGLLQARRLQPDIIITDIVMQSLSGIDLCKAIKEDMTLGHIPVILLTGSPSAETRLQGVEGGADDYIAKPFEKEILIARVASLLKSRNSLQKYFYNEVTLQQHNLKVSEEDRLFIDRCIRIVKDHLDDEDFTIKTLAAEIGMSHSSLYKKIKSVSGQSVNAFIRFIRLRRVAELLIDTEKNINEAAMEAGFNDLKYFREQFGKLFGMPPSEYIRKYRGLTRK